MRLLLDTNVLIWWFVRPEALRPKLMAWLADEDCEVWVSPASLWEMAIKHKIGRLPEAGALLADASAISDQGFRELPISHAHAIRAGGLPLHHRDPFDRLIVAQSLVERLPVASSDRSFDAYGVERFWQ